MVSTSRKKVLSKKQCFFFWTDNVFPLAAMKYFMKNIWGNEIKRFPLARKWVSTCKNKVCLSEMVSAHVSDGFD